MPVSTPTCLFRPSWPLLKPLPCSARGDSSLEFPGCCSEAAKLFVRVLVRWALLLVIPQAGESGLTVVALAPAHPELFRDLLVHRFRVRMIWP